MNSLDSKNQYSLKEIAALLKVHPNTIRNYLAKGILTGHKVSEPADNNPTGRGIAWTFTQEDIGHLLYALSEPNRMIK